MLTVTLAIFVLITFTQIKTIFLALTPLSFGITEELQENQNQKLDLSLDSEEWKIIWQEEFDNKQLNSSKWNVQGGTIETAGKFDLLYGKIEIRTDLPKAKGILPKFWLTAEKNIDSPRIDILKTFNSTAVDNFSEGFHTFTVEWDQEKIVWLLDGKKTFTDTNNVPKKRLFLYLSTTLPQNLDIDYIRVYKKSL